MYRFRAALLLAGMIILHRASAQPGVSLYTIPVVFHVLHQNGSENIADAQIADAMDYLNEYYDSPTWNVIPPFDTVVGDMDVSFVLASTAPNGDPTNGIDRIETPLTVNAGAPESYVNPWPRNHYLNIWTVASLDSSSVAYLTARPDQVADLPCMDGIMIRSDYVGTIGTGHIVARPVLTQAVGRFFNLKMLYEDPIGGGPCGDDEVADTPPCPLISYCNAENTACSDLPANIENFMMFSYCQHMFTKGQRERLHDCLNSPVAQRDELASGNWTSTPACPTAIVDHHTAARPVTVLPNPFSDAFTLQNMSEGYHQLEVQDLCGRTIMTVASVTNGRPVALGDRLGVGSYLLVVRDVGRTTALRIMKGR